MRRSRFLLVLAALLVVGLFVTTMEAAATGQKEGGKVDTLTFWFPGVVPKDLDAVLKETDARIQKAGIAAHLVFNFVPWSDYQDKLRALVAAGDTYECHFDGDWGAIPSMAPQGAFLSIEDLVPKYAPKIWAKIDKSAWAASSYAGHIIGIPWRWPKSERRSIQIRYDLYKKYGLKDFDTLNGDVFTLDDYEKYLDAVVKNEPGMIPCAAIVNPAVWAAPFAYLGGYGYLSQNVNIVYKLDDPQMKLIDLETTPFYKDLLTRFRRWYVNGYFEKDVLAEKVEYKQLVISGKAASMVHIFDSENELTMQIKPSHPDWEIKAFLLNVDKVGPLSPPMNNILLFNKNGKNPEKAMAFWEWMHASQDNYDLVMYGIKGKDWNEGPNRTVEIPAPYSMADSPYYGWNGRWCAWWPELERPTKDDLPHWMDRVVKATFINDKVPPLTGFFPSYDAIKTEWANRVSLKQNIGDAMELGVLDPAVAYDDYIAKEKAAGIDKILAELQKQLDVWRATKK
jgi:putative aldouronate transport system substrate-binding protein